MVGDLDGSQPTNGSRPTARVGTRRSAPERRSEQASANAPERREEVAGDTPREASSVTLRACWRPSRFARSRPPACPAAAYVGARYRPARYVACRGTGRGAALVESICSLADGPSSAALNWFDRAIRAGRSLRRRGPTRRGASDQARFGATRACPVRSRSAAWLRVRFAARRDVAGHEPGVIWQWQPHRQRSLARPRLYTAFGEEVLVHPGELRLYAHALGDLG
jgi:hypothetical protein